MRRFRRLARWMAPGCVLLWLAASLNVLNPCCVDMVQAAESEGVATGHVHTGTASAHEQAGFPTGHPCSLILADRNVPLAPAVSPRTRPDAHAVFVVPAPEVLPSLRMRTPLTLAQHGPPPNYRHTYLHTLRLRI